MAMYHLQNMKSTSKRKYGLASITSIIFLPGFIASFLPADVSFNFHWYQWEFSLFWFGLVSLFIFLGWLMTGVYMQMRRELQVSSPPWVWGMFKIFLLVYVMGFIHGNENDLLGVPIVWVYRLFIGWVLMAGLTYMILWWEGTDGVDIHRLSHLWNTNRIQDAICEIPRWLISLILAWGVAVALMAVQAVYGVDIPSKLIMLKDMVEKENFTDHGFSLNLYGFVIAMMFFLMRDIALLLFFYFSEKPNRALGTAGVYWVVLYLLIPLLLGVVGMGVLYPVFLPNATVNFVYAVLPPLLQAGLMWIFTIRRWRTRFGSPAV
jgi:hypothetical protein